MPFHPAIDEPSNACPDSNLSAEKALAGTETCCSLPRVSVKRRSTNLTSFSLIIANTSAEVVLMERSPGDRGISVSDNGNLRVPCHADTLASCCKAVEKSVTRSTRAARCTFTGQRL